MAKPFKQLVSEWAKQSEARLTAVYRRSFELLGEEMATTVPEGGRVPFKTGNLARSVLASKDGLPEATSGPPRGSNVGLVAATLKMDETAWIGYQAVYARRMNYGFVGADSLGRVYNQEGFHFIEYAIAVWPTIVELASEDIQARVEARKK